MCSLSARGLWVEMLALMHEAEPYGHLVIAGHAPTPPQLAMLVGAMADEIETALSELENAGVFSRNRSGIIYSRRMTKDEKRARIARQQGKKGGNPSLSNTTENRPSVNPQSPLGDNPERPPPDNLNGAGEDNPTHKAHARTCAPTQKPEARSQREPTSSSLRSEGVPPPDEKPDEAPDAKLYRRGREVLGKSAGGQITKLRQQHGDEKALDLIEQAAAKHDPPEWIAGVLKNGGYKSLDERERATWKPRVDGWRENGFWLDQWGPKPNEPNTLVPVDLRPEVTADELRDIPDFLKRGAG